MDVSNTVAASVAGAAEARNVGMSQVTPGTDGSPGGIHGFSAEVPLSELVPGDNVLGVSLPTALVAQGIGSLDLTLEVAK